MPIDNCKKISSKERTMFRKLSKTQRVYYSNLLTLKKPKWEKDATSDVLITAKVDPIPHQVEAAQFVFRNPFQGGVILADEVGLGKTIETGLVLSQLWAEGKRKILIIAPKSLRHQWQDELRDLFYLESEIIDTRLYAKVIKGIYPDPLGETEKVLITNEHFVAKYESKIQKSGWDIVVIDEAHKLRNVWKPAANQAKRAKTIRSAIAPFKKILLTATPMQNNLMELYGLCTFLDPYALGTAESFKRNFVSVSEEEQGEKILELKFRIGKFFKRELRKNVQAFIPYTNRNAVTIPFEPTDEEEELRISFENYLKDPETVALPPIANGFLRLVYFKLMASSSFALKNSLSNLYARLIHNTVANNDRELFETLLQKITDLLSREDGSTTQELIHFKKTLFKNISDKTFDGIKEHLDESVDFKGVLEEEGAESNYDDIDLDEADSVKPDDKSSKDKILAETSLILHLIDLSRSLRENSKGSALVAALDQQFKRADENDWPKKAIIFTEFKTTQAYIVSVLEQQGLSVEDDIVIFNGDSGTAEERRKLVEDFKNSKKIFVTTEAGAEGLNLQFCNLLINYDLPWNPQRIEQRIGRCHRYGQKLDVVVVNFTNKKNIADQRILELLETKFKLFEGAFGASNTVLGVIESGTDIEKEILSIYLNCRDQDEIEERFDDLLTDNSELREEKFGKAKEIIMSEFDEEVQSKLKAIDIEVREAISEKEQLIKDVVLSAVDVIPKLESGDIFSIKKNQLGLQSGKDYSFKQKSDCITIGPNHPVLMNISKDLAKGVSITFNYTGNHNIKMVEEIVGVTGNFVIYKVLFRGIESKEVLFPIFTTDEGKVLSTEYGRKLLTVDSIESTASPNFDLTNSQDILNQLCSDEQIILDEYNEELYGEEVDKIDSFFEDLQELKRREIADIDKEISKLKKERRKLRIDQQRELNNQIQKLKKQVIKKEEEVIQYRKKNSDEEQKRIKELNDSSQIKVDVTALSFGLFKVI